MPFRISSSRKEFYKTFTANMSFLAKAQTPRLGLKLGVVLVGGGGGHTAFVETPNGFTVTAVNQNLNQGAVGCNFLERLIQSKVRNVTKFLLRRSKLHEL